MTEMSAPNGCKDTAGMPARDCGHVLTTPAAIAAIRGAQNARKWGYWAARRYAARRGAPHSLFTLALILHRATEAGF